MNPLFLLFATSTCLAAIAVVVSQSVVRMAFWLVVSLGSVAGLFFLADADFVAAAQLLIYVGGTLVLLIFGIMLTASGPAFTLKTPPAEIGAAVVVGFLFLLTVFSTMNAVNWDRLEIAAGEQKPRFDDQSEGQTLRPIGLALLGVRPDRPSAPGYLLPFEIISVHLLAVLIGAAYLARAKRRNRDAKSVAPIGASAVLGPNAVTGPGSAIEPNLHAQAGDPSCIQGDLNHGE